MKAPLFLLLLSAPLAGIFLSPDGKRALTIPEVEPITVEDMNDVQRALTLKNFRELRDSDLASLKLKTPRLATPGDVAGDGLKPKSNFLLGRTPNLEYVPSKTEPVTNVRLPESTGVSDRVASVGSGVIKQPEFYTKPQVLASPSLSLPQFVVKDSGEICLPEVAPINLPQLTQPGDINIELPRVNLAQINADLPEIAVKGQSVELPSVTVQKIDTALPDVNVQGIEHEAFPDINVPDVDAELPSIALPSAQQVVMPQVNLPEMDHSMPDVNIPVQAQLELPEINLAKIDSELPEIDVDVAAHADLPSLELPGFDTSVPTFEIKSKQAEDINVQVPSVPIPELRVQAAPQIEGIDMNAFIPSVVTLDGAEGHADINTLGQKALIFPKLIGENPKAPILPDLLMRGASASIAPKIEMPDLSILVPKIEAPAAEMAKLVIQKEQISIPSVRFPMPKINFHQVVIPKMPKIKACVYDCPVVVPIPELHESVVNKVNTQSAPQPVSIPENMVLSYMLVPQDKYNQLKLKAKKSPLVVSKNKKTMMQPEVHPLQKYWGKQNLPNEVARAYQICDDLPLDNANLLKGSYVGASKDSA